MTEAPRRAATGGPVRRRFWLALALACVSAALCVLTLLWHDWIEAFGIEPDGGNGSLEWVIVAVFALAALGCGALARGEWRRRQSAQTQAG